MPKLTKIVPRGKWILVKPAGEENRENENGLIIPAAVEQEQKAQGVVEAVGDEVKGLKVGDTVVFGTYAGENLKIKENSKIVEHKLLLDEDVIAFIK